MMRKRSFVLGLMTISLVGFVCLAETVAGWLADGIPASNAALTAAAGDVVIGDGTRFVEHAVTGDIALTSGGAVTVNTIAGASAALTNTTTPSLTAQAGSTNTGFFQVNGKTSGALKLTTVDATAQTLTLSVAAQTAGAATVSIADMAGTSRTFVTGPSGGAVSLVGPTAARVITVPDAASTMARTDAANTFSGISTYAAGGWQQQTSGRARVTVQADSSGGAGVSATNMPSVTLVSGRTYSFEIVFFTSCAAAGGWLVDLGNNTGMTISSITWEAHAVLSNAASGGGGSSIKTTSTSTAGFTEAAVKILIHGTIVVTTGGTFGPRWAQNFNSGTSSVLVGSYMWVEDMP